MSFSWARAGAILQKELRDYRRNRYVIYTMAIPIVELFAVNVPAASTKFDARIGQVDYGCRADEQTKVNATGDYTYVIGSEAQRAAISRVAGATFLPFSDSQTTPLYLLWLRNELVSPGFAHSAQAVTQADDAAAAALAMGPYYSRVFTCALATLTAKGITACES